MPDKNFIVGRFHFMTEPTMFGRLKRVSKNVRVGFVANQQNVLRNGVTGNTSDFESKLKVRLLLP